MGGHGLTALRHLLGVAARGDGIGGVAVEPAVARTGLLREAAVCGDAGRTGLQPAADFRRGADALRAVEEVQGQKTGRAVERPDGGVVDRAFDQLGASRSEEHTSELQSLMRISYAVFCLKKKKHNTKQ